MLKLFITKKKKFLRKIFYWSVKMTKVAFLKGWESGVMVLGGIARFDWPPNHRPRSSTNLSFSKYFLKFAKNQKSTKIYF